MSLKKIAEELGLSLTTVSRALNGYPEVAASTRQAVRDTAARLHHHPDARARGLALGRVGAVGVVLPFGPGSAADLPFLAIADAMSRHLTQTGLDLLIVPADIRDELPAYRRALETRRVDAFVVTRTRVDDTRLAMLQAEGALFVAYGRSAGLAGDYAWFDFEHEAGARLAAARLLDFGHRAFGYIGAAPLYSFAAQRYRGFVAALADAGAEPDPAAVLRDAFEPRAGYQAMQALLERRRAPTAVLVDNALAGAGALQAARDAGRVPGRDLSVIVCGGPESDGPTSEAITRVDPPDIAGIGAALASMTLARLAGMAPSALQYLAPPVLVPGQTDGPCRASGHRAHGL